MDRPTLLVILALFVRWLGHRISQLSHVVFLFCSPTYVVSISARIREEETLNIHSTTMLIFVWSAVAGWLAYVAFGAIYRLFFHPLSRFPGPRAAALTRWYEFYYDVVKPGQFIWKIESLHEKYGTFKTNKQTYQTHSHPNSFGTVLLI